MNFKTTFIIGIAALGLLLSCHNSKKSTEDHVTDQETKLKGDSLLASITRTPCYGRCPHYTISIYKTGLVVYDGKQFVNKSGIHTTRLSEDKLEEIKNMAAQVNYYALEDKYEGHMTDLPSCTTVMNTEKGKKEVFHYGKAPDNLIKFERYLDGLFANLEWVKAKE